MGYYSQFDITAKDKNTMEEIPEGKFLEKIQKLKIDSDIIEDVQYAIDNGESKWYEWYENFIIISKKVKDWIFVVNRTGEDNGDISLGVFLNGKGEYWEAPQIEPPEDELINKLLNKI